MFKKSSLFLSDLFSTENECLGIPAKGKTEGLPRDLEQVAKDALSSVLSNGVLQISVGLLFPTKIFKTAGALFSRDFVLFFVLDYETTENLMTLLARWEV